jgi:hypothetical protein
MTGAALLPLLLAAGLAGCAGNDVADDARAPAAASPPALPASTAGAAGAPAPLPSPASGPSTPRSDLATSTALAGWYRDGRLQPCGRDERLAVQGGDLEARARAGGMDTGDPVYVRVEGHVQGATLHLARVVQVGSPSPVRDCPMRGTSIQAG